MLDKGWLEIFLAPTQFVTVERNYLFVTIIEKKSNRAHIDNS